MTMTHGNRLLPGSGDTVSTGADACSRKTGVYRVYFEGRRPLAELCLRLERVALIVHGVGPSNLRESCLLHKSSLGTDKTLVACSESEPIC